MYMPIVTEVNFALTEQAETIILNNEIIFLQIYFFARLLYFLYI